MLLLIDNPQRAADAAIGLSGMSMANQTYCVQYTVRPDLFRLSDDCALVPRPYAIHTMSNSPVNGSVYPTPTQTYMDSAGHVVWLHSLYISV